MAGQISIPTAVLGLQGALNVAFGIYGVVRPDEQFGGGLPRFAAYALSVQLLNMGLLTIFAASRPSLHRRTLIARVGVHLLAGYLFWQLEAKYRTTAITDLVFGAINAIAIPFVY